MLFGMPTKQVSLNQRARRCPSWIVRGHGKPVGIVSGPRLNSCKAHARVEVPPTAGLFLRIRAWETQLQPKQTLTSRDLKRAARGPVPWPGHLFAETGGGGWGDMVFQ